MKKINAVSMNLQLERQRNDRGKSQKHIFNCKCTVISTSVCKFF